MKAIRVSMYSPEYEPAGSTVVTEDEITTSLEVTTEEYERVPGIFVICDVFDTDHKDIESITLQAIGRQQDRLNRERNMAVSYYWNGKQLRLVSDQGALANPAVAPLTADEVSIVLRQLRHHPNYVKQKIVCFSEDRKAVTLTDGKIEVADV